MSTADRALLVVAKKPIPGRTKTRLCPPLTHVQAADLYACFLRDTLDTMRNVTEVRRIIGYLPENAQDYFHQLAPDMDLIGQQGKSLGERLDNLLKATLNNGFRQAVIVDSDSPTLPPDYVTQAFERLQEADVVLGPTRDGGYYLIGAKQPQAQLVRQVKMSTSHVLADTLELAKALGVTVSLLPIWYDVDNISDLSHLDREISCQTAKETASATRHWLEHTDWNDHSDEK
jgi:rSAM/selenodomain-associated transferase 1